MIGSQAPCVVPTGQPVEGDPVWAVWSADLARSASVARQALDQLIAQRVEADDRFALTTAQVFGASLLDELDSTDAERVFRFLAAGQVLLALRLAYRNGGGEAASAVERLATDALRLPLPAFDYDPDAVPGADLSARGVARSARTGLGMVSPWGSTLDRLWVALRRRVVAARCLPTPVAFAVLDRIRVALRRLVALAVLLLRSAAGRGPTARTRPSSGPGGVSPGAAYVAQPRRTRGPNIRPSLLAVEGWAGLRAPRGSAVAA